MVARLAASPSNDALDDLWKLVRVDLETSLPPSTFALWVEPLRVVGIRERTLLLSAPTTVRAWVERRYAAPIEAALGGRSEGLDRIAFVDADADETAAASGAVEPASVALDDTHTFERFVIGEGNRLAHASALAVAESPGDAYNPLFLHGPPGLGKSHLLGAIAEYMRRNHRELTVHITTAERFTAEFVGSLRRDGPERFKARYRNLDALLIDDVQVLEGKERTEEEFVHTFNTLYGAGKQIVLSSDRPPEALSQLAERLRDRFSWGLTVELEAPDLATRIAVLWRLAASTDTDLEGPGVLEAIAARAPGNVRLLEGAMTRVLAVASLLREPVSLPLVQRALGVGQKAIEPAPEPADLPSIEAAVCAVYGLTPAELRSPSRAAKVVQARQVAMYLARELTGLSLAAIARSFDRDHTTVLHAVRAVTGRLEPGSDTSTAIHRVRSTLGRAGPSSADG